MRVVTQWINEKLTLITGSELYIPQGYRQETWLQDGECAAVFQNFIFLAYVYFIMFQLITIIIL